MGSSKLVTGICCAGWLAISLDLIHLSLRHSGVKTKIDRLLREFSSNAWAVQLTREAFSEHDVANALKR